MGDLGRKAFVVEEKKVEFPDVADQELLQTVGEEMASLSQMWLTIIGCLSSNSTYLLVATVANLHALQTNKDGTRLIV